MIFKDLLVFGIMLTPDSHVCSVKARALTEIIEIQSRGPMGNTVMFVLGRMPDRTCTLVKCHIYHEYGASVTVVGMCWLAVMLAFSIDGRIFLNTNGVSVYTAFYCLPELGIRGGIEDNSKIILLISQ